jgi:hypothetical protein
MAIKGLRQNQVLQYTFGLFLILAGFISATNAQVLPPIDPTRITEVPAEEPKPCPHYSSEVVKLHRGQLSYPTMGSMKVGDDKKYSTAVQVIFDSIQVQYEPGDEPKFKDRRVLLYLDCASQDTPPEPYSKHVIWSYRATLKLLAFKRSGQNDNLFNLGSIQFSVTGNEVLMDVLKPYNGMEVVVRLIKEPKGVNRHLMKNTILKALLHDRRNKDQQADP